MTNFDVPLLGGFDVQINDLLGDVPKLKFHWPEETAVIREFNEWLAGRFGYSPTYLYFGNTIVTTTRGLTALREATKELI